jgi:hypothetical protein
MVIDPKNKCFDKLGKFIDNYPNLLKNKIKNRYYYIFTKSIFILLVIGTIIYLLNPY